MTKRLGFVLLLVAAFTLPTASSQRRGIRFADEDSMVVVRSDPHEFSLSNDESAGTMISANVYHPRRQPTLVVWRTVVVDESGRTMRVIPGDRVAQPGEALTISQLWNGRDDSGEIVPPGTYRFSVQVRVAPVASVGLRLSFEQMETEPDAEEITSAVGSAVVTTASRPRRATSSPHVLGASLPPPPNEPDFPYNFYFGSLHNQTSYTDGGHANDSTCASSTKHAPTDFTPAQAYQYARDSAQLDFLGITDHNHLFDNACSGCSGATVIQRYHDGLDAAAAATVDGSFVAIYGMEWGYISRAAFPNEGHVNLFEIPKLFGWESGFHEVFTDPAGVNYPVMYTAAKENPSVWGTFGSFNHPSTDFGGDFNMFNYTADGDDVIALTAVISGPAVGYSTTQADTGHRYAGPNRSLYPSWASYDVYNRILGAGFHVAPVADPDVHCSNYGTSTHDRTVILAAQLTKAAIFDAIKNRRVYATSDNNAQIVFMLKDSAGTTHYMGEGYSRTGGPVAVSGEITLHASHYDPDGEAVSSIEIFEPVPDSTAGESTLIASSTTSPLDYTFTPSEGKHSYYVYVTQEDGDEIWSAPIWINQGTPVTPDFAISVTPAQTVNAGKMTSGKRFPSKHQERM